MYTKKFVFCIRKIPASPRETLAKNYADQKRMNGGGSVERKRKADRLFSLFFHFLLFHPYIYAHPHTLYSSYRVITPPPPSPTPNSFPDTSTIICVYSARVPTILLPTTTGTCLHYYERTNRAAGTVTAKMGGGVLYRLFAR